MFPWSKERKRREMLSEPFPAAWLDILHTNVPHYERLSSEERAELCNLTHVFVREKQWEGCAGLTLTEEMQATIAAQACLLILHLDNDVFPNVENILVYPADYVAPGQSRDPSGVIDAGGSQRLGEAWAGGPIVLSWSDAYEGGRNPNDGHNVVLHEFAHKLDMADGTADGVPPLENDAQYEQWSEVMSAEYAALVEEAEKGHHGGLIDHYGATNPAEFFAVTTEVFFEKSAQMLAKHPRLYETLSGYYHQDPAAHAATDEAASKPVEVAPDAPTVSTPTAESVEAVEHITSLVKKKRMKVHH